MRGPRRQRQKTPCTLPPRVSPACHAPEPVDVQMQSEPRDDLSGPHDGKRRGSNRGRSPAPREPAPARPPGVPVELWMPAGTGASERRRAGPSGAFSTISLGSRRVGARNAAQLAPHRAPRDPAGAGGSPRDLVLALPEPRDRPHQDANEGQDEQELRGAVVEEVGLHLGKGTRERLRTATQENKRGRKDTADVHFRPTSRTQTVYTSELRKRGAVFAPGPSSGRSRPCVATRRRPHAGWRRVRSSSVLVRCEWLRFPHGEVPRVPHASCARNPGHLAVRAPLRCAPGATARTERPTRPPRRRRRDMGSRPTASATARASPTPAPPRRRPPAQVAQPGALPEEPALVWLSY